MTSDANDDINKAYVSPYDRFLFEFDACHEKSLSQLNEIKKYKRIVDLRDHATPVNANLKPCEGFLKDF